MKRILSTVTALAISALSFAGGPKGDTYKIDNELSSVEWVGKKVTGQHNGSIMLKEGNIMVENGMISSGTIMMDMNTIVVEDIEDEGTNAKLKGHLMSDDFFGVEKNPTSTFKITKVEKKEGELYHIHGDLTIKGITEKVAIPTTVKMEGNKLVAIGETEIDRTKFKIRYGSGKFFEDLGDKMIDDEFTIRFKVGAIKG
ncbi:MAG: YceI family protein [Vicingaceae bacterium]